MVGVDLLEHAVEFGLHAIPFGRAQFLAREILFLVVEKRAQQVERGRRRHHPREHGGDAKTVQHGRRTILAPPVAVGMVQIVESFQQRGLVRDLGRSKNHTQKRAQIDLAGRQVPVDGGGKRQVPFDRYRRQPRILA
jgi:hypothetical protein